MKLLIILRGLPGSGKSTLANDLCNATDDKVSSHFETDMHFMVNGKYIFDRSKLGEYHQKTIQQVEEVMKNPKHNERIIVSNTFTQRWEMKPYIDLANKYGYKVQEITVKADFGSVHNVPPEAIQRMKDRWEE